MAQKELDWDNVVASMNVQDFLTTYANGAQLKYTTNEKGNPIFAMHYGDNKGVSFELFGKNVAVGSMSKSVYEEIMAEETPNWEKYQFDIVNSEENPALKLRKASTLDLAAWSDLL